MRPLVTGHRYMVSAGHYVAALAAARILDAGGNAVDAGVAGGICINVVQPDLTNLGGVAPICLYEAATGSVRTISGLGPWPAATDVDYFSSHLGGRIAAGVHRSVVPGALHAWLTALEQFGTLSLADVLEPAIELAAGGFTVTQLMYDTLSEPADLENMRRWPSTAAVFLDGAGNPPAVGSTFIQEDLARTLRRLVDASAGAATREEGIRAARDLFYRGEIADEMVEFSRSEGGWLRHEDLAGFSAAVEYAPSINYRGHQVFSCGPWSQGPVVLQSLALLAGFDLPAMEPGSADAFHLIVEALKCGFADRDRYYADPNVVPVPLDGLLSTAYAEHRRKDISMDRAAPRMPDPGDAWAFSTKTRSVSQWRHPDAVDARIEPDTSYIAVVDGDGNAFSATPSDGPTGTPIVPGLGIVISGRGLQSWIDPRHPSAIAPGKRPRLTPSPGMVLKADGSVMPYGTPGTDVQPQAMTQFLVGVLDHGFDIQAASEAPRLATYSFPGSGDPHTYLPGSVKIEARAGESVVADLVSRGHVVELWPSWTGIAGSIGAVLAEPTGTLYGAADPRRTAYAIGW